MTLQDEPAARMPGDILLHDWLEPNRISMYRLAKAMHVPQVFVSDLVHGNKRITTQAAFKLAKTLTGVGLPRPPPAPWRPTAGATPPTCGPTDGRGRPVRWKG